MTTIYSYFSTWSTNFTASNLPGPGRLLGKLYPWAGSTLEQHLGIPGARKTYTLTKDVLHGYGEIRWMMESGDITEIERVCEILLICAK